MKTERECEKPDDGLVRSFLGRNQRKNNREYDDLRRSPYLLLSPSEYDDLAVRILSLVLRLFGVVGTAAIGLISMALMAYGLFFTVSTAFSWLKGIFGV